jgi:thiol-disulfide isomerase/thioredoxin
MPKTSASIVVIIFAVLTLACSCLALPALQPASPTRRPAASAPVRLPTSAGLRATPDVGRGFTIVRLHPSGGNLNEQLAGEVAAARALSQDPYVEFDASWCPACQAIESSLDEENALMLDALQGVYVARVDVDEWANGLNGTGFEFAGIPIFFGLNDQGGPNGVTIDGNAWGANIPENMAPPLKDFFQSH